MNKVLLVFILLLFACTAKIDNRIFGEWNVQSNYYRAIYKIEKQNGKIIGKVLYYNDDTTVLHETGTDKDIFLEDLKFKENKFIDAVSGATKTNKEALTIEVKHKDTLKVTSYVMHKPSVEIWIRKQKQ